jgi:hypothetical protein
MKPQWKSEIGRRLAGLRLEPAREAAIFEELAQYHRTTQSPAASIQGVRLANREADSYAVCKGVMSQRT